MEGTNLHRALGDAGLRRLLALGESALDEPGAQPRVPSSWALDYRQPLLKRCAPSQVQGPRMQSMRLLAKELVP